MMNWKGFGRSGRGLILTFYNDIRLEMTEENHEKLNKDIR
jgi:hypothetical protein